MRELCPASGARSAALAVAAAALLLVFACYPWARPPITVPKYALVEIDPVSILFKDDLDKASLNRAIDRSLNYYSKLGGQRKVSFGPMKVTVARLVETMEAFRAAVDSSPNYWSLSRKLREGFRVFQAQGRDFMRRMLMTGYYEPLLPGSRKRSAKFRYPIYGKPDDLKRVRLGNFSRKLGGKSIMARCEGSRIVPYYTRSEIDEKGVLRGMGLELFWLDDPVKVFFLHVQGSGAVLLPTGEVVQVNYAASNGRPYRSIGRYMVDNGYMALEDITMDSIMDYLKANPEMMKEILHHNESYVFFRTVPEGPLGSLGVPVTPGRSIATDPGLFPKGALAFIRGQKPVFDENHNVTGWEKFTRFVLNQDAGGAIKGAGRLDLFMGRGPRAKGAASRLKHDGALYFILLKESS